MHPLQEWLTHPRGLATRLRELRQHAGLTGRQLAGRLEWDQSKVSRIERGKQLASADDVQAWAAATGLDGQQLQELLAERAAARTRAISLRDLHRAGQGPVQAGLVQLAVASRRIRQVELIAVPGLLQTPDYARAILEKVRAAGQHAEDDAAEDIDSALEARLVRQQVLYDPGKTFEFVLAEPVLRWLLCDPAVMRAQLDRLSGVIGMPRIRLGILPLGVRLRWIPTASVTVYEGPDVADAEHLTGVVYRGQDVADINQAIDRLWDDAVTGDDARRLIMDAARSLPVEDSEQRDRR